MPCNLRLKNRDELFKKFIEALVSSPPPQQQLNKQMQYFKEQIEIFSELKEGIEKLFTFKAHRMLGDFETTNKLVTDMLETHYKILRIYKKLNVTSPIPTTHLAKDTASHSISNLSELLNGD